MIEVLTTDSQKLLHQLNTLLEQESRCQPKVCGLKLIESAHDNGLRMTARLRDFEVKDLLSLTQFFGFDTETFSLAVNLLDRFLSKMKVQAKHLGCVGLSCFYLAVKSIEEERNVPLATDLIRISQYRFTVSDLMRMEKIVLEKVCWKVKATTAFQFLQLYYSLIRETLPFERRNDLNFERLEAQLKACHCRIIFSKAKPSVLALAIIALEIQALKYVELTEGVECIQKHSKISGRDLTFWQELVSKCLTEYSSNKCSKPNGQKLKWIVSGRTARQLKHSYYRITHLPTIPETMGFWVERTPVHEAAQRGESLQLQQLINSGACVNQVTVDSITPLHAASLQGQAQCVQLLLAAGAQVDARNIDGSTPLCDACASGNVECVKLLLSYGAKVNPPLYTASPLHEACMSGNSDCVRLLIDVGANLEAHDCHFGTPLHVACAREHLDCVKVLLNAGANVNAAKLHETALHHAAKVKNVDLIVMLIEFGGNIYARDNRGKKPSDYTWSSSAPAKCFEYYEKTPLTLSQLCRVTLRKATGVRGLEKVAKLNIPPRLIDYLSYN